MPQILSVSVLIPLGRVTHFGTLLTPSQVGSSTEATLMLSDQGHRHARDCIRAAIGHWDYSEQKGTAMGKARLFSARILFGVFGPGASPGATITYEMMAGWWFGTFFIFHFIYGIIIPTDYPLVN